MKLCTGKRFLGSALHSQAASFLCEKVRKLAIALTLMCAAFVAAGPATAATPKIQFSATAVHFGSTYITMLKSATLTIHDPGTAALVISKATVSGPFTAGNMNPPRTIKPGGSISVILWFHPASSGAATGTLRISSNASAVPTTVALSGTGLARTMALTPLSVNFESVSVGSTATETGTLKNTGAKSLVVYRASTSTSAFTLSGLPLPSIIAAGKSLSFTVHFAPQSVGAISGSASFSTAEEGSIKASLTGTGAPKATRRTLAASPASLAFGSVDIGDSATKSVSVKNTGNASVSIAKVTMSGSGYAATGLSPNESLGAGKSASLKVVFTPATASSSTGDIQISSNASDSSLAIDLSGTGVQTTQHSVALSWAASKSSIAGYDIYRSTVSGGPYTTQLNGNLVTGLAFTDADVQAGTTYYYVVVAVSSNGAESSYSNQASATIP